MHGVVIGVGIAIGVLFIVLGLITMTPAGARLSVRMEESPFSAKPGYEPMRQKVIATRVKGVVVFVVGVAWIALLTQVSRWS